MRVEINCDDKIITIQEDSWIIEYPPQFIVIFYNLLSQLNIPGSTLVVIEDGNCYVRGTW